MICQECKENVDNARVWRRKILLNQSSFQQILDEAAIQIKEEPSNSSLNLMGSDEEEEDEEEEQDYSEDGNIQILGLKMEPETVLKEQEANPEPEHSTEPDHEVEIAECPESMRDDDEDDEEDEEESESEPEHPVVEVKSKGRPRNRQVTCEVCGDEFRTKGLLGIHMREVHKKKRTPKSNQDIICEVCGKSFTTKPSLNLHLKTHEERTSELCTICNKYFLSLKLHHREQHTALRAKQTCHVCGKQYYKLRSHLKWHGSKRFQCQMCEKGFFTQNDLRRHMHIHTKEKVKCRFCPHEATHEENSRLHMRKKHPVEYEEFKAQNQRRWTEKRTVGPIGGVAASAVVTVAAHPS